jgi:hypothetical protein
MVVIILANCPSVVLMSQGDFWGHRA